MHLIKLKKSNKLLTHALIKKIHTQYYFLFKHKYQQNTLWGVGEPNDRLSAYIRNRSSLSIYVRQLFTQHFIFPFQLTNLLFQKLILFKELYYLFVFIVIVARNLHTFDLWTVTVAQRSF